MRKQGFLLAIVILLILAMGCGVQNEGTVASAQPTETQSVDVPKETEAAADEPNEQETEEAQAMPMTVTSSGIVIGVIDPKYGKNGDMVQDGVPTLSIPLTIENAPEGTVCFAVYMDDPDAKPLAGYNWVHWAAVNIASADIPENFSADAGSGAVQGTNDYGTIGYGGPAPPDRDHTYVIAVFALDEMVALEDGFAKDEFDSAINTHVLETFVLEGVYVK